MDKELALKRLRKSPFLGRKILLPVRRFAKAMCKPGETAAQTGCTPKRKEGKPGHYAGEKYPGYHSGQPNVYDKNKPKGEPKPPTQGEANVKPQEATLSDLKAKLFAGQPLSAAEVGQIPGLLKKLTTNQVKGLLKKLTGEDPSADMSTGATSMKHQYIEGLISYAKQHAEELKPDLQPEGGEEEFTPPDQPPTDQADVEHQADETGQPVEEVAAEAKYTGAAGGQQFEGGVPVGGEEKPPTPEQQQAAQEETPPGEPVQEKGPSVTPTQVADKLKSGATSYTQNETESMYVALDSMTPEEVLESAHKMFGGYPDLVQEEKWAKESGVDFDALADLKEAICHFSETGEEPSLTPHIPTALTGHVASVMAPSPNQQWDKDFESGNGDEVKVELDEDSDESMPVEHFLASEAKNQNAQEVAESAKDWAYNGRLTDKDGVVHHFNNGKEYTPPSHQTEEQKHTQEQGPPTGPPPKRAAVTQLKPGGVPDQLRPKGNGESGPDDHIEGTGSKQPPAQDLATKAAGLDLTGTDVLAKKHNFTGTLKDKYGVEHEYENGKPKEFELTEEDFGTPDEEQLDYLNSFAEAGDKQGVFDVADKVGYSGPVTMADGQVIHFSGGTPVATPLPAKKEGNGQSPWQVEEEGQPDAAAEQKQAIKSNISGSLEFLAVGQGYSGDDVLKYLEAIEEEGKFQDYADLSPEEIFNDFSQYMNAAVWHGPEKKEASAGGDEGAEVQDEDELPASQKIENALKESMGEDYDEGSVKEYLKAIAAGGNFEEYGSMEPSDIIADYQHFDSGSPEEGEWKPKVSEEQIAESGEEDKWKAPIKKIKDVLTWGGVAPGDIDAYLEVVQGMSDPSAYADMTNSQIMMDYSDYGYKSTGGEEGPSAPSQQPFQNVELAPEQPAKPLTLDSFKSKLSSGGSFTPDEISQIPEALKGLTTDQVKGLLKKFMGADPTMVTGTEKGTMKGKAVQALVNFAKNKVAAGHLGVQAPAQPPVQPAPQPKINVSGPNATATPAAPPPKNVQEFEEQFKDFKKDFSLTPFTKSDGSAALSLILPKDSEAGKALLAAGVKYSNSNSAFAVTPDKAALAKQILEQNKPKIPDKLPEDLKVVRSLGGGSGADAKLVQTADGKKLVMKEGKKSPGQMLEEVNADSIYQAAGLLVPQSKAYQGPGYPVKLAQYLDGAVDLGKYVAQNPQKTAEVYKEIQKGFVMDALLANWDVVGPQFNNIMVMPDGKVWRVDNGGAMRYSGFGNAKLSWNNDEADGIVSMLDAKKNPNTAKVYKGISKEEIAKQVNEMWAKKDSILKAASPEVQAQLKKRMQFLYDNYAVAHEVDVIKGSIYANEGPAWKGHPPAAGVAWAPTSEDLKSPLFKSWNDGEERKSIPESTFGKGFLDHYKKKLDSLPPAQSAALKKWTGHAYGTLGPKMRECPETLDCLDAAEKKWYEDFSKGIAAMGKLDTPVTVWRGITINGPGGPGPFLKVAKWAMENGRTVKMPGGKSSSPDPGHSWGHGSNAVVFEVKARTGAYVNYPGRTNNHGEIEFLQGHDVQYKVVGIKKEKVAHKGMVNLVQLEEV